MRSKGLKDGEVGSQSRKSVSEVRPLAPCLCPTERSERRNPCPPSCKDFRGVLHIVHDWQEPFTDGVCTFAQVKNPSVLEGFQKHHGYFMDDELQELDSSARAQKGLSFYSTKLFAVINEEPGVAAQRSDLIREYRSYLELFDAHQTVAEAARAAVDTARKRGFEKEIDGKFKCSLAYHGVA
jgi:hypothetical protein